MKIKLLKKLRKKAKKDYYIEYHPESILCYWIFIPSEVVPNGYIPTYKTGDKRKAISCLKNERRTAILKYLIRKLDK